LACIFVITLDKMGCAIQKVRMIKAILILAIAVVAVITEAFRANSYATSALCFAKAFQACTHLRVAFA